MPGAVHAVQYHVDDIDAAAYGVASRVNAAAEHENRRDALVRNGPQMLTLHPAHRIGNRFRLIGSAAIR